MFYSSGCRVSEIAQLKFSDLSSDYSSAIVLGKGSKQRRVFFSKEAQTSFKEYLLSRKARFPNLQDEDFIFGRPLKEEEVAKVVRFLLSEGKYEITALDLKNKHNYKRLKHFKKRINVVFGDVNDDAIVDALIKTHDVVIHLAGVLPPFANIREDLCKEIDYKGTQNVVDAISNYNPSCYLLYASSTSVYGSHDVGKLLNVKSLG